MPPKRTPVKKTAPKKKAPVKKKAGKKVTKKTTSTPAKKKAPSKKAKPKDAETIRLTVEADENVVDRFRVIYEWHKAETDGKATADEVALLIFESGLDHFEKSLDGNGVDKEAPAAASGSLVDDDEMTDEDFDFDDAFEARVGA